MLHALIKELAGEIHLDEVEIRRLEAVVEEKRVTLRFLQRRAQNQAAESGQATLPLSRTRVLIDEPTVRPTFTECFAAAVKNLAGKEIYVANVFDEMVKLGIEVPEEVRPFRIRIGTELNRFEERNILRRTQTGGGNVPNRYRLKEDDSDLA